MPAVSEFYPAREWAFLQELGRAVQQEGGQARLVGGCVRSALLGESVNDFDMEVFGLQPASLEAVLGRFAPVTRVGKAFGVYKLRGWPVDVGLPRTERKQGTGHRGFEINIDPHMSLEAAARRRDFTVNAIYLDSVSGSLDDPLGGVKDLRERVLRHCSDRFPEDPLRVLRAMQFAARLQATVSRDTLELCRNLNPEGLSPERFYAEWEKLILLGKTPSLGLGFLKQCGWLTYFPELAALDGCPQDERWHPEGDVWTHTLHCMDAFCRERTGDREEDLIVGFAVLCHDMGKPSTTFMDDGAIRSHGHESAGLKPARAFLERLNVAGRLIEQILPLVKCHMRPAVLFRDQSSSGAIRRLSRDCGRLDRLMRVFRADAAGRPGMADDSAMAVDWIMERARRLDVATRQPKALLSGQDLLELGWESGPAMGTFLRAAYEEQLDGRFTTREEALEWLRGQPSPGGGQGSQD